MRDFKNVHWPGFVGSPEISSDPFPSQSQRRQLRPTNADGRVRHSRCLSTVVAFWNVIRWHCSALLCRFWSDWSSYHVTWCNTLKSQWSSYPLYVAYLTLTELALIRTSDCYDRFNLTVLFNCDGTLRLLCIKGSKLDRQICRIYFWTVAVLADHFTPPCCQYILQNVWKGNNLVTDSRSINTLELLRRTSELSFRLQNCRLSTPQADL